MPKKKEPAKTVQDKDKAIKRPALLKQYSEQKAKYPDTVILFRAGDFYETYKEDAHTASKTLGITLTRLNTDGTEIATFPHHAIDTYLPKLIRAGHRVAIVDKLEDQKLTKDVNHGVKELVTPGVVEGDNVLDNRENKADVKTEAKQTESKQQDIKSEQTADVKTEAKQAESKQQDIKSEQTAEEKQERKQREPQMVTVNGDKVSHAHTFPSSKTPGDWFFTARINGEQLRSVKITTDDAEAYLNRQVSVEDMMKKYYPTKVAKQYSPEEFKADRQLSDGRLVDALWVFKDKNEESPDLGKYKLYAEVGGQKLVDLMSREDLSAYFDRTTTPAKLVEKYFAERLHLASAYAGYSLPEGINVQDIRVTKEADDKWKISAGVEGKGRTEKKELDFNDGFAFFKSKTVTREQLAAKYLSNEILDLHKMDISQSKSLKI